MIDLLHSLAPGARVLDLGARHGSFSSPRPDLSIVRLDLVIAPGPAGESRVAADAARLPFRDAAFHVIIANHSLEHFVELDAVLREIGRVLRPGGALYIAVPDSTTLTDRIYRWLGRGGGHVNPFRRPADVIGPVERLAGVPHRGTLDLISSLAFLNSHNFTAPPPRKIALFAFGNERFLAVLIWIWKTLDRWFGTRLGHYGWAFYFGNCAAPVEVWRNVCVRCGSGHPDSALPNALSYRCALCGGWNLRI
jgi:SAM-dependent methyltransferase